MNDSHSALSKRKIEDDSDFTSLEESIKRVRIAFTPGELRLGRDIKDLERFQHCVTVTSTANPASIILNFLSSEANNNTPNRFLVTVPRYYPHDRPLVKCLEHGFICDYINFAGEVNHSFLTDQWSAIGTLKNIIDLLIFIRSEISRAGSGRATCCEYNPTCNMVNQDGTSSHTVQTTCVVDDHMDD